MVRYIHLTTLLFVFAFSASAQKAPIKFGDMSIEDLQMTVYPADTTAPAVILCDYGFFNSINFLFTRTLRVKILKKEGYSWANHIFPVNARSTIRGITSNLENGKIIQEKLKSESIFYEKVTEGYYRVRIAMPNVKVGSVIDIMFTYPGIPQSWKFQEVIPERYNEIEMKSDVVRFNVSFFGFEPLYSATPTRWIAKDMPSFKAEPYMNSPENYITKLEFDILEIGKGANHMTFTSSWDEVFVLLTNSSDFGLAYSFSGQLNDLSRKIAEKAKTKVERLIMAYDTIKKEIKWDENESLVTSNSSLAYVRKMKLGNSADINLSLAQLLKNLEIEALPVVMSTRQNGMLSPLSPAISKLNYVIVMAKIDNKTFLLDATEPYMPYNLLPLRCLNYQGRTYSITQSEWVEIKPEGKDKKIVNYDLEIYNLNSLKGTMTILSSDYAAYDVRKEFHKYNSEGEFIDNFSENKPGLQINKAKFENIEKIGLPISETYEITIGNSVSQSGNNIYINPMLFDKIPENPFKNASRKYPVDFAYNLDKTVISVIKLPENYSVLTLPSRINMSLPGDAASFVFEVSQVGSVIKMLSRFRINKSLFLQNEYSNLREFYNQTIKKQSEPIILTKL
jgi:hypothetical protein